MGDWRIDLISAVTGFVVIAGLVFFRVYSHPRLRVRGTLGESPRLRRLKQIYFSLLGVVALGMIALLGEASGGPSWLRPPGAVLLFGGLAASGASLVFLVRERLKSK